MDEELVKSESHHPTPLILFFPEYASHVERTGWILAFWGMLTQVSNYGFPSYNIVLGFWGTYCSFSKHGRATFGSLLSLSFLSRSPRYICFLFLSIFLDIIFCSLYGFLDLIFLFFLTSLPLGPEGRGPTFNFALTMMIFGLFTKVSLSLSLPFMINFSSWLLSTLHLISFLPLVVPTRWSPVWDRVLMMP
jgi:hypothetical protein